MPRTLCRPEWLLFWSTEPLIIDARGPTLSFTRGVSLQTSYRPWEGMSKGPVQQCVDNLPLVLECPLGPAAPSGPILLGHLWEPGPDLSLALPAQGAVQNHGHIKAGAPPPPPTQCGIYVSGMGYGRPGTGFRNVKVQPGLGQICCVVTPPRRCSCYSGIGEGNGEESR